MAAPDPAWLTLRGLKTLALRERQAAGALELAGRLSDHPRSSASVAATPVWAPTRWRSAT